MLEHDLGKTEFICFGLAVAGVGRAK